MALFFDCGERTVAAFPAEVWGAKEAAPTTGLMFAHVTLFDFYYPALVPGPRASEKPWERRAVLEGVHWMEEHPPLLTFSVVGKRLSGAFGANVCVFCDPLLAEKVVLPERLVPKTFEFLLARSRGTPSLPDPSASNEWMNGRCTPLPPNTHRRRHRHTCVGGRSCTRTPLLPHPPEHAVCQYTALSGVWCWVCVPDPS